jgi:hypothetical protein
MQNRICTVSIQVSHITAEFCNSDPMIQSNLHLMLTHFDFISQHCRNQAINVYVQSGDADSAKQAESTLHRMEDLYKDGNSDIKPNVISYTSVMQG